MARPDRTDKTKLIGSGRAGGIDSRSCLSQSPGTSRIFRLGYLRVVRVVHRGVTATTTAEAYAQRDYRQHASACAHHHDNKSTTCKSIFNEHRFSPLSVHLTVYALSGQKRKHGGDHARAAHRPVGLLY